MTPFPEIRPLELLEVEVSPDAEDNFERYCEEQEDLARGTYA